MDRIKGSLTIVKVEEHVWDVVVLAEHATLKAFMDVYPNLFYVEHSVFNDEPAVIAPAFDNKQHAETWAEYWRIVFADPENACKSCPTVKEFMDILEQGRSEIS